MKNLFIIFLFIGLVSCNDFLETEPQQSQDLATIFDEDGNFELAIRGAYNRAQENNFFGADLSLVPDLMSNNINWQGSFAGPAAISTLNMTVFNLNGDGIYANTYRMLNDVNAVLANIDGSTLDQAEIDQLRGEALFLRGASLFEAVRLFGRPFDTNSSTDLGIPIILDAIITEDESRDAGIARSTVQEVYDQAISDITAAAAVLPSFVADGRANLWVANSYLAKIAFQQRDYTETAALTLDILTNGGYALVGNVVEIYLSEFSNESIWEIGMTIQDNPGVNGSLPTFYNANSRDDISINADMFAAYDAVVPAFQVAAAAADGFSINDHRLTILTNGSNVEKYEGFANDDDNPIMARLPEIMLMRAEAIVRNSNAVEAESVNLLNQIRLRSIRVVDNLGNEGDNSLYIAYSVADFATAADLLDAIILERRVELAYEGNRFHDLNRLRLDLKGVSYAADARVFPIPQDAMDNNANLVQNPGY